MRKSFKAWGKRNLNTLSGYVAKGAKNISQLTSAGSGGVGLTDYQFGAAETFDWDWHASTERGSALTDGRKHRTRHIKASNSLGSYDVGNNDELVFIDLTNAPAGGFTVTLPALPSALNTDGFNQVGGGTFKSSRSGYKYERTWGRQIQILDIAGKAATKNVFVKNSTGSFIGKLSTNGGKLVLQAFWNSTSGAWAWAEIGCCGGEPYGYGGASYPEVFEL